MAIRRIQISKKRRKTRFVHRNRLGSHPVESMVKVLRMGSSRCPDNWATCRFLDRMNNQPKINHHLVSPTFLPSIGLTSIHKDRHKVGCC